MSTKPRTREHFPRMKERGGRRRHGKAIGVAVDSIQQMWLEVFLGQPVGRKSDYTLASGRKR